jgi:hypothetical protein
VIKKISTKQKGDIAEAKIAELIILYGDIALSCYKPISDDEGIDLIVKEKGSLKTMYIQIKSRFGDEKDNRYKTFTVKTTTIVENPLMAFIFCLFEIDKGDFSDSIWFVPAEDFIKLANKTKDGKFLRFVRGKKNGKNIWENFLISKKELANKIIERMRSIK